jgi:hypothetical protein
MSNNKRSSRHLEVGSEIQLLEECPIAEALIEASSRFTTFRADYRADAQVMRTTADPSTAPVARATGAAQEDNWRAGSKRNDYRRLAPLAHLRLCRSGTFRLNEPAEKLTAMPEKTIAIGGFWAKRG